MTTTVHALILGEIADELGEGAQEHLTPECRRGLIHRFRKDLDHQYHLLLDGEERTDILGILQAAESEL